MASRSFSIRPLGPFSLRESALFGFGQHMRPAGVGTRDGTYDGVLRLAFCLDGTYEQQVGVEVRHDKAGINCVVHGAGDLPAVQAQVARALSLDHDATGYEQVGERDPVIARLQAAAPGLRPPLFYSPYEAAVWSVLSARRPGWQMDRVRCELGRAHGATFQLAGVEVAALPGPSQLLGLGAFPGIEPARLERIHGVARAAQAGLLDAGRLRSLEPDSAIGEVCKIKGIGPFYGSLIVIRALGHTDVLPRQESKARDYVRRLYELPGVPNDAELARIAQPWRPWRTWCTVLLRSAADRLLESSVGAPAAGRRN